MKRVSAGLLTVAAIGLLLWSGMRRPPAMTSTSRSGSVAEAENPAEARVRALLDGAERGDVDGYLAAFGGTLRVRIAREVTERGRDAFADDLRRAAAARKSHAVFAPEPDGPAAARVVVETVYPDRNERQTYLVEDGEGGWLVTDVESARGRQPKAKFGSPANYQEPEGVPVQREGLTVETGIEPPESAPREVPKNRTRQILTPFPIPPKETDP